MFDELIARVEAGEVSAELETEVCLALGYKEGAAMSSFQRGLHWESPPVLNSLDAAYALKKAVLPGWRVYGIDCSIPNRVSCFLKGPPREWPADAESEACVAPGWENGVAPTHAGALVAAILRAWEGKG